MVSIEDTAQFNVKNFSNRLWHFIENIRKPSFREVKHEFGNFTREFFGLDLFNSTIDDLVIPREFSPQILVSSNIIEIM